MARWSESSLAKYRERVKDALSRHEMVRLCPYLARIHTGSGNTKTGMMNEGTSSGSCGSCSPTCINDCEGICYVMTHVDGVRPACLEHHAENLQARRGDPEAYYEMHFSRAEKAGVPLRLNETGDFETRDDVTAFGKAAVRHPSVKVIGYTKRSELLRLVSECNRLPNVQLHFSLACKHIGENRARRFGVPCTDITTDISKVNCPAQRLPKGGWHCRRCAELGCGCFSDGDVHFFAH